MTSIAFVSAKGSPGTTTAASAVAAVWPADREALLAEFDPSGGDLAIRFGLPVEPGITTFVLDRRRPGVDGVLEGHAQVLPGGLKVVVGPAGADVAGALDRELGALDQTWWEGEIDVIADCGRLSMGSVGQRAVLRAVDHVVAVVRPDASSLAHGRWLFDSIIGLRPDRPIPRLVVVGDGVFTPQEMAAGLGCELRTPLPFDERAASMLAGEPGHERTLGRSNLIRAAAVLAQELVVAIESHEEELVHAS